MNELLEGIRRRLRLAWGVATTQWLAPAVAGLCLTLVVAGRLAPWAWPEPSSVILGAVAIAAIWARALTLPVTLGVAARAADRGLGTFDAFATALELQAEPRMPGHEPNGSDLAGLVQTRAAYLATGQRPADAVPISLKRKRLGLTVALVLTALGLALAANQQDVTRRRRAADQRILATEATKLRRTAAELSRAAKTPEQRSAVARLEELARQLAGSASLAKGSEAATAAARDLGRQIKPDGLAQKAAVQGLERSLGSSALPGTSGNAAAQLRAAAAGLNQLSPEARAALAARLAALAATQVAGNPQAAAALAAASGALAAGDASAAASALAGAAAAQDSGAGAVADEATAAAALGAVSATAAQLASGQGVTPGQGQGQGQGQGNGGGGTNAATGTGQGGANAPAGGTGRNPSVGLQSATVYEPPASSAGETLETNGPRNEGPSTQTAKELGPTATNKAQVPLGRVAGRYQAEATRALDRGTIAPAQRALVSSYFAGLTAEP